MLRTSAIIIIVHWFRALTASNLLATSKLVKMAADLQSGFVFCTFINCVFMITFLFNHTSFAFACCGLCIYTDCEYQAIPSECLHEQSSESGVSARCNMLIFASAVTQSITTFSLNKSTATLKFSILYDKQSRVEVGFKCESRLRVPGISNKVALNCFSPFCSTLF